MVTEVRKAGKAVEPRPHSSLLIKNGGTDEKVCVLMALCLAALGSLSAEALVG
ncbi:MAG: hypothetical protein LBP76_02385 [Treponema sp.]|jgi:hypothetical protein|nr:hypothetical protein [Treponema sp.]